jgi:hypothetical protein
MVLFPQFIASSLIQSCRYCLNPSSNIYQLRDFAVQNIARPFHCERLCRSLCSELLLETMAYAI